MTPYLTNYTQSFVLLLEIKKRLKNQFGTCWGSTDVVKLVNGNPV